MGTDRVQGGPCCEAAVLVTTVSRVTDRARIPLSRRARAASCLLSAAAVIAALCPAVASADTAAPYAAETITFQENLVAVGATVTSQYAADFGVEFGTASSLGFPGTALAGVDDIQPTLLQNGYTAPGSSPVVALAARSLGSGPLSGREFPPPPDFLVHLDYPRASLSFELRAYAPGSSINGGAEAVAYGADGTQLDEVQIDVDDVGSWTTVDLATPAAEGIQYVRVASLGSRDGVQIDDLQLPAALPEATPSWHLATTETNVDLVEGDSTTIPVQIVRQNGSTGAVTVSADDASNPALSALSVEQSPSGAPPDTVDVVVTAEPGQVGNTATLTLSGVPAASTAGVADEPAPVITVHVLQDLGLLVTGPTSAGNGCAVPVQEVLHASGTTAMTVEVTASDGSTQAVKVNGPGNYDLSRTQVVKFGSFGVVGKSNVGATTFTAAPAGGAGFAPATATLAISQAVPHVTGLSGPYVTPEQLAVFQASPIYQHTVMSDSMSFSASGLPCQPLQLQVGTDKALSTPFTPSYRTSAQTFQLPLPADAETGPVDVVDTSFSPGLVVAKLAPVIVLDIRRDDGLPFANNVSVNNFDWQDFEDVFGPDNVNDCLPGGCWKDAYAVTWYNFITGSEPLGLCFGFTMLMSEFFTRLATPKDFGADAASDLQQPLLAGASPPDVDRSPLGKELVDDEMSQFDTNFISLSSKSFATGVSVPGFVALLGRFLAQDGMVFIQMKNPGVGAGHSVIAYGLTHPSTSTWVIDTYNPNVPFSAAELSTAGVHAADVTASQIVLNSQSSTAAWTMSGDLRWSGPMAKIGFTTLAQRPLDPSLGTTWADILGDGGPSGGAREIAVSQITTGGKELLTASGSPRNSNLVHLQEPLDLGTGGRTSGIYSVAPGRSYTVRLTGERTGSFGLSLASPGSVVGVASAVISARASDAVSFTPGQSGIAFSGSSASPVQLEVSVGTRTDQRSLLVDLGSGLGRTTVGLSGGALTVQRLGPATSLGFQFLGRAKAAGSSTFEIGNEEVARLTPTWGSTSGTLSVALSGQKHALRHLALAVSAARGSFFRNLLVAKPAPH